MRECSPTHYEIAYPFLTDVLRTVYLGDLKELRGECVALTIESGPSSFRSKASVRTSDLQGMLRKTR